MLDLADLLATLPLPEPTHADPAEHMDPAQLPDAHGLCGADLVHELGADLPAGHLHVWGGPTGAGKTAFLLCLLKCAAARGRRVVYATYDLPPESLAMRLLAMTADVEWRSLPDPGGDAAACKLVGPELARAHAAREVLSTLPFEILPARGLSAPSLQDRLVRQPFRPEVLAVDYLQGVIREPGSELGTVLRDLAAMAAHLHVAVVCAVRPGDEAADTLHAIRADGAAVPDRVGWLAPPERVPGGPGAAPPVGSGEGGVRRAEVVHNRYGSPTAMPLYFDEATGSVGRAQV